MNLTQDYIRQRVQACGCDLNRATRHISQETGSDTRSVREVILATMGWSMPARYKCRDVGQGQGQGRSERGRHR